MKLIQRCLSALALAVCAWAAQAQSLHVSITGSSEALEPLFAAAGPVAFVFDVPDPIAGATPQGDNAFVLSNLPIQARLGSSTQLNAHNTAGWFAFANGYRGVDLRLSDVVVAGDMLQLIVATDDLPFTGSTATPVLSLLDLSGLGGGLFYYPLGVGAASAQAQLSGSTYSVSTVPEPAAWMLLPLGLLALRRWGSRGQA